MLAAFGVAAFLVEHFSLGTFRPLALALFFVANVKALSIKKIRHSEQPARVEPVWKDLDAGGDAAVESGASPISAAAPVRKPARPNYFVRHWRGELSLPVSYWINGTLLAVVSAWLIAIIGILQGRSASLRLVAVTSLVFLSGSIVSSIWSAVGIWRSAQQHGARGGSSGWALTARIMIVLGIIVGVNNLVKNVVPAMHEFALIAVGRDPVGSVRVIVSPDGRSIRIVGALREGAAAKIVSVLDAEPTAKWLVLDSNGGRVLEAKQLAQAVRGRQLNTYVDRVCVSACTYVFLAGATRATSLNVRIGFHQPSFVGINSLGQRRATQAMLDVYRADGLPDDFVRRIGQTPPSAMWYPTRDELLRANVITRVANASLDPWAHPHITTPTPP